MELAYPTAFEQGRQAYRDHKGFGYNPYEENNYSHDYEDWEAGWQFELEKFQEACKRAD